MHLKRTPGLGLRDMLDFHRAFFFSTTDDLEFEIWMVWNLIFMIIVPSKPRSPAVLVRSFSHLFDATAFVNTIKKARTLVLFQLREAPTRERTIHPFLSPSWFRRRLSGWKKSVVVHRQFCPPTAIVARLGKKTPFARKTFPTWGCAGWKKKKKKNSPSRREFRCPGACLPPDPNKKKKNK